MTTDVVAIIVPTFIGMGVLIALGIWGQPYRDRFQAWMARQQDR